MLKTIIEKLERKKIMTWMLMWLNWSVATINAMLQFIYTVVTRFSAQTQDVWDLGPVSPVQ